MSGAAAVAGPPAPTRPHYLRSAAVDARARASAQNVTSVNEALGYMAFKRAFNLTNAQVSGGHDHGHGHRHDDDDGADGAACLLLPLTRPPAAAAATTAAALSAALSLSAAPAPGWLASVLQLLELAYIDALVNTDADRVAISAPAPTAVH